MNRIRGLRIAQILRNTQCTLCSTSKISFVRIVRILQAILRKTCANQTHRLNYTVYTVCGLYSPYKIHYTKVVRTLQNNSLCILCTDYSHPSEYSVYCVQIVLTLQNILCAVCIDSTYPCQNIAFDMYGS